MITPHIISKNPKYYCCVRHSMIPVKNPLSYLTSLVPGIIFLQI